MKDREDDLSVVTSCGECWFIGYGGDICRHPSFVNDASDSDVFSSWSNEIPPPALCPLRQRDLVIHLEVVIDDD